MKEKNKKEKRIFFTVTLSQYEIDLLRPFFVADDNFKWARLVKRLAIERAMNKETPIEKNFQKRYEELENRFNTFLIGIEDRIEEKTKEAILLLLNNALDRNFTDNFNPILQGLNTKLKKIKLFLIELLDLLSKQIIEDKEDNDKIRDFEDDRRLYKKFRAQDVLSNDDYGFEEEDEDLDDMDDIDEIDNIDEDDTDEEDFSEKRR